MMTEPTPDVCHPVEGPAAPTPSWVGPYRTVEGRDEVLVPCDVCRQPMYESCRERRRAQGRRDCGLFCDFLDVAGPDRREVRMGLAPDGQPAAVTEPAPGTEHADPQRTTAELRAGQPVVVGPFTLRLAGDGRFEVMIYGETITVGADDLAAAVLRCARKAGVAIDLQVLPATFARQLGGVA